MANQPFLATIIGIPNIPAVKEVNVRSGPGTNMDQLFKAPVGMANLTIIEVKPDAEGKSLAGKTYQWFRLAFPEDKVGWVRDDLINVIGDGTSSGYFPLTEPELAFNLERRDEIRHGQEIAGTGTTPATTKTTTTESKPSETAPATETTTAETPVESAPPVVISMGKTGVNVRPGPGTTYNPPVMRIPYLAEAEMLDARPGDVSGDPFKWIKIRFQGKEGWLREDFARLKGEFGKFGVSAEDQYPGPIRKAWWVRDFNLDEALSNFTSVHWGWDYGADLNTPIFGGPNGGTVIDARFCQKCGTQGASTVNRGFSLSDRRVLQDSGWNFGYGHFVMVRYLSEQLPESVRQTLSDRGFAGAHIFVLYAHLQQMIVKAGQELMPNQQIATCGNSGNSEAPHLHLEVRAHVNAQETQWANMRPGLMTPAVLFRR